MAMVTMMMSDGAAEKQVPLALAAALVPIFFGVGVALTVTTRGAWLVHKVRLFVSGSLFLVLSRDFSWKRQPDPDAIKGVESKTITVVFVRHGESVWNDVFNKGANLGFFVRLARALATEAACLFSPDSVFFDSPLSEEGMKQAVDLLAFMRDPRAGVEDPQAAKHLAVLRGSNAKGKPRCVFVVSNLRRAIQTTVVGLWGRLKPNKERLLVLSSLQEVSRNVDCVPLAPAREVPVLNGVAARLGTTNGDVLACLDASLNWGNRALSSNGLKRMLAFADWALARDEEYVVVGGHSLWFRSFFRTFLPHSVDHVGKAKKLHNCGVVAFRLSQGVSGGQVRYRIDPDSVVPLYKGFAK